VDTAGLRGPERRWTPDPGLPDVQGGTAIGVRSGAKSDAETALSKFGPEHCDRLYTGLLDDGLSPTTVRHIHNAVSGALDLAVDWRWLARNPAKRSHPPSRARSISLGDVGIEHLRTHRERCACLAAEVGVELGEDAFMFSSSADGGKPVKPDSLTQFHARLMEKLEMDHRFHELRHFMATSMEASGVVIRTIAGRLGHADPSLTLRTYAHWLEAADREAADVVEGVLGKVIRG
jgi:hypothetical protein